jgi:hypothetical protein
MICDHGRTQAATIGQNRVGDEMALAKDESPELRKEDEKDECEGKGPVVSTS